VVRLPAKKSNKLVLDGNEEVKQELELELTPRDAQGNLISDFPPNKKTLTTISSANIELSASAKLDKPIKNLL